MLDFLKGNRDAVSIGRVALVFFMALGTYFWTMKGALPEGFQEFLYGLLVYNLGGKVTGAIDRRGEAQEKLKPDVGAEGA